MSTVDMLTGSITERITLVIAKTALGRQSERAIIAATPLLTWIVKFLVPISAFFFFAGIDNGRHGIRINDEWISGFFVTNAIIFALGTYAIIKGFSVFRQDVLEDPNIPIMDHIIDQLGASRPLAFVTPSTMVNDITGLLRHIFLIASAFLSPLIVTVIIGIIISFFISSRQFENIANIVLAIIFISLFLFAFMGLLIKFKRNAFGDTNIGATMGGGIKLFVILISSFLFLGIPLIVTWFPKIIDTNSSHNV